MSTPTLSVIVPVKDASRYIGDLISTAALSRRTDIEYLFVDNGSTDDTVEQIERRSVALPSARVLISPTGSNAYAARNLGIRESSAPVITFHDADDWVAPGYLDAALALFEQRDVDVMRFDFVRATGPVREVRRVPVGIRERSVLGRDFVMPVYRQSLADFPTTWGGLMRRDFLERHELWLDERFATAGDREWWWRVLLADGRLSVENLRGYFYRRGVGDSLTRVGDERTLHYLGVLQRMDEIVRADRDAERFLPKVWRTAFQLTGFHTIRLGRLDEARREEHERRVRALFATAPPEAMEVALAGLPPKTLERLAKQGLEAAER